MALPADQRHRYPDQQIDSTDEDPWIGLSSRIRDAGNRQLKELSIGRVAARHSGSVAKAQINYSTCLRIVTNRGRVVRQTFLLGRAEKRGSHPLRDFPASRGGWI